MGEADTACLAVMGEIQGRCQTFPNKQIKMLKSEKHLPTSKFKYLLIMEELQRKQI